MFRLKIEDREMLQELILQSCENTSENIAELASLQWTNLKSLRISQFYDVYCQIRQKMTAFELSRLLENQWPALEKLDLFDNDFGNTGLQILLETSSLPNLEQLDVGRNNITSHGLPPLVKTHFTDLTLLSLEFNQIRSAGVKLLVKADLQKLVVLKISMCEFGDEGARHLIKGHWPNLQ